MGISNMSVGYSGVSACILWHCQVTGMPLQIANRELQPQPMQKRASKGFGCLVVTSRSACVAEYRSGSAAASCLSEFSEITGRNRFGSIRFGSGLLFDVHRNRFG